MIKHEGENIQYYDRNGVQIVDGSMLKFKDGVVRKVYLTADGKIGTDATNPKWIETGRASECEYGIYPLTREETEEVEVIELGCSQEVR